MLNHSHPHTYARRGATLIGILVSMMIIVILAAIGLTAMKGAMGGGGTAIQENQATTFADRATMQQLGTALYSFASSNNGRYPSPAFVAQEPDVLDLNTTANFWSMMIAQGGVRPEQLVSHNENSSNVMEYMNYDRYAYRPLDGVFWDPNFKADLHNISHTSYAHTVLYGDRYRRGWVMSGSSFMPLIGNRGPKDGIPDVNSYACDNTGNWAGNYFYADGHADFVRSPAPHGDNYFVVESGDDGDDAIIAFTQDIWDGGFELQWD